MKQSAQVVKKKLDFQKVYKLNILVMNALTLSGLTYIQILSLESLPAVNTKFIITSLMSSVSNVSALFWKLDKIKWSFL